MIFMNSHEIMISCALRDCPKAIEHAQFSISYYYSVLPHHVVDLEVTKPESKGK